MSTFILVHGAWHKEEAYRDAMYGDCSEEDVALAALLLTPEPLAPLATPLDLSEQNFGRVPRVYIETLHDNAVTLSKQRMAAEMAISRQSSRPEVPARFPRGPQSARGARRPVLARA
jgi:hypothetical protein